MPHFSRKTASLLVVVLAALSTVTPALGAQKATAVPHDYTAGDVAFMQGMIIHHAQAIVMSDWAPSRGAEPPLLVLASRIALSQRDEITMMQHWLQDRHLAAPDPLHMLSPVKGPIRDRSSMNMPGMDMGDHPMMMKGMLTPAEMRQLEASRGIEFDRLYLTGMIKHHQGALDMVAALFATPGAGQQSEVFMFATDADATQRAEMGRMETLLHALPPTRAGRTNF